MSIDPESGETIPEGATAPFPNPCETAADHDAEAQARVITQYRESPKLKAGITIIAEAVQALEDCAVQVPPLDDPNIATGVNLDVTGELVGQSRVLKNGTQVNDTLFRVYIAMRILRNHTIGSSPEFIAALETIFGVTPFRYMSFATLYDGPTFVGSPMSVGFEVGVEPPGIEPDDDIVALLDAGPVPQAMAVDVARVWYDPDEWFGFDEDVRTGAMGFGLESDPDVGGRLAMLF